MNDKQTRRTPDKKPGTPYRPFFGILAAGIASYITALCYLPTSGIFSTLPVAALLALAASRFCREKWEIYVLMGIMPAVVPPLLGFSPKRAVFVGIACVFQSVFALFAKRAFVTYRNGRAAFRKKSLLIGIAATLLCLSSYLAAFGNPVGALLAQGKTVACCGMSEGVRRYFDRAGITEVLGESAYFWSADQAILDLLDTEIAE